MSSDINIEKIKRLSLQWLSQSQIRTPSGGYRSIYNSGQRYYFSWCGGRTCLLATAGATLVLLKNEMTELAIESGEHILNLFVQGDKMYDGAIFAGDSSHQIQPFYIFFAIEALLQLYLATNEKRYLQAADKAGKWVIKYMQRDDGSIVHLRYLEGSWHRNLLVRRYHSWEAIMVRIFALLNKLAPNAVYEEAIAKHIRWLRTKRDSEGTFYCCYYTFLEQISFSIKNFLGLGDRGGYRGKHPLSQSAPLEAFLEADDISNAAEIYRWLKTRLSDRGLFYQFYYDDSKHAPEEDVMPTAHFGLVLLRYLDKIDFEQRDILLNKIVEGIGYAQAISEDSNAHGGIHGLPGQHRYQDLIHSWDTAFTILFLDELNDTLQKAKRKQKC